MTDAIAPPTEATGRVLATTLRKWVEPAGAFSRLAETPGCILLETQSSTGACGQPFSFVFAEPFGSLKTADGRSVLDLPHQRIEGTSPFPLLRRALASHSGVAPAGAAGYLGYELHRFIENTPVSAPDAQGVPECLLWLYNCVIAFDHSLRIVHIIACEVAGATPAEDCIERMRAVLDTAPRTADIHPRRVERSAGTVSASSFTKEEYREAVGRAKDYIAAGDIYQVNLSQRFTAPGSYDAYRLYRRLRERNPAPYAAFINAGKFQIVSSSPECFLSYDPATRLARTRPIKGTRPRGRTADEDLTLGEELLRSAKDRAENVMIVDLERNDLGRVCRFGSVHVPQLLSLESHPTVHHLVSTVEGTLGTERDAIDLLASCFPGGSITGAPKIRAMEIIDELEPVRRGVYTGSIGFFGFDGSVNLNIAIRTAIVKDGACHFHTGGGIVADSDPHLEYEETLHKARAFFEAITCR